MPQINLIAAMANNRVIGKDNQMPWHLPADLKHFKAVTMSHPIIMGRKTYESIGRPLPGRQNIVISRNPNLAIPGVEVCHSVAEALTACASASSVMIIGGANLYQQMLPKADYLYLTFIDLNTDGDAYFPDWCGDQWTELEREAHSADANNPYDYQFVTLKRAEDN